MWKYRPGPWKCYAGSDQISKVIQPSYFGPRKKNAKDAGIKKDDYTIESWRQNEQLVYKKKFGESQVMRVPLLSPYFSINPDVVLCVCIIFIYSLYYIHL